MKKDKKLEKEQIRLIESNRIARLLWEVREEKLFKSDIIVIVLSGIITICVAIMYFNFKRNIDDGIDF